jgi:hypothetical protein
MAYDTLCFDLALAFLDDDDSLTDARAAELAQHIQTAIEDWLAANPKAA